jgi:hypothetical protein
LKIEFQFHFYFEVETPRIQTIWALNSSPAINWKQTQANWDPDRASSLQTKGEICQTFSLRFSLNSSSFSLIFGWLKFYQCRQQYWVTLRSNQNNSDHEPQISNPCIFQYTWDWKKWRSNSCSWAFFLQKHVLTFHFPFDSWWTSPVRSTEEDDRS